MRSLRHLFLTDCGVGGEEQRVDRRDVQEGTTGSPVGKNRRVTDHVGRS